MSKLVEMKSNPVISIASLTKGKVYNGVYRSGEVEAELTQLHCDLTTVAVDFMDARFKTLQQPPISDFYVLNPMLWPYDRMQLVTYGVDEIQRLVNHFAPVLTEDELQAAPQEWLSFKLHVCHQRTADLKTVYRDLLIQPPVAMKNFLPVVEIMLTLQEYCSG